MTRLEAMVAAEVEARPDAPALVDGEVRWTYAELWRRSRGCARALIARGVKPGDRVCLLASKTAEAVAALLGILAAGGVYVPLEAGNPAVRLAHMLVAMEPCYLVATADLAGRVAETLAALEGPPPQVLWLDAQPRDVPWGVVLACHGEGAHASGDCGDEDLAVILFTSGSTGEPKGVPLSHAGVSHFVSWSNTHFAPGPGDRLSCHSPLSFDASLWDIFRALSSGAELHLVPPSASLLPSTLAAFIRRHRITQWDSVPSVLTAMASRDVVASGDFPELAQLIWYGEVFPTWALRYWMKRLPHVQFTNTYGPTETSITASTHRVPTAPASDDVAIPIGRPVAGKRMIVLDEQRHAVACGTIGDLYVGGVGLSPGYWRDPLRTAAAFVSLPGSSGRWYRTGDRAHIDAEGVIHFHGRMDRQIKSRGCRIELDEIAAALGQLPELAESAVVAVPTEGFEGMRICAAYVPMPATIADPVVLRRELARMLPSYMLPSRWLAFKALPRNRNGKIDLPALARRFRQDEAAPSRLARN